MRKTKLCRVCGKICYGYKCRECFEVKDTRFIRVISPIERELNEENRMRECIDEFKLKHTHVKYTNKELLQALIVKLDYIVDGMDK